MSGVKTGGVTEVDYDILGSASFDGKRSNDEPSNRGGHVRPNATSLLSAVGETNTPSGQRKNSIKKTVF